MDTISFSRSLALVLDLAYENIISDEEVAGDRSLALEQVRQKEACDFVATWARNMFGSGWRA